VTSPPQSILAPALTDLADIVDEFRNSSPQNSLSLLQRFTDEAAEEPMSGFLSNTLPTVDFDTWWQPVSRPPGSMVGSGMLPWPRDRGERVALQLGLCRALVTGRVNFMGFLREFCYVDTANINAHVRKMAAVILEPLLKDLRKMTEQRVIPALVSQAMRSLPKSGDTQVDSMLENACQRFKDSAPAARAAAVEKLWDAWERIKTLCDPTDKKLSTTALLGAASDEPNFRQILEEEARRLTDIGNNFHIRHFETNRIELTRAEHYDYLFHRLYALIALLLATHQK